MIPILLGTHECMDVDILCSRIIIIIIIIIIINMIARKRAKTKFLILKWQRLCTSVQAYK